MSSSYSAMESAGWHWMQPGMPEHLEWRERSVPVAPAAHVVVRNRAIGLNPVDWKFIEWGPAIWSGGQIPGVDGAGEVVAVGDGVSRDWLGQRVAYHQWLEHPGSFATHTVLPARALMRIPPGLSWERAASLPCPALTALQACAKVPAPDAGGSVALVTGAGGAVGTLLVQLLTRRWRVVAMCDKRHWARLQALGAHECVPYVLDAAHDGTGPFDAVFDTVSGAHAASLATRIAANGHLVCVQDRVGQPPVDAFTTSVSLHEVALNAMHRFGTDAQWRTLTAAGERLMQDVQHGALTPVTIEAGPMRALPDLLAALRDHRTAHRPVVSVE
ncbi:zinc-binding dehydrogenase [Burkholderia anthina]|uniref:zinc-binding dehydrogenase n=1 Tax=Burkholderia anthina TaxID=179879 RepID=UPI00158C6983